VREGDQQEARGDIEAALGGIGAWNASWAVLLDRYADAIRADERSRLEGFRIAPQPSMSSDQVSDREISHGEGDEARREAAWNESRSRSHYGHWDSQDEFNAGWNARARLAPPLLLQDEQGRLAAALTEWWAACEAVDSADRSDYGDDNAAYIDAMNATMRRMSEAHAALRAMKGAMRCLACGNFMAEAQVDGLSATDYKEAMEQGLDMARDIGEDLLRAQRQLVRMREVLEAKGLWG
jgi:hypothetical protein